MNLSTETIYLDKKFLQYQIQDSGHETANCSLLAVHQKLSK